jgi:uncharacterized protein YkwD
MRRVALTVAAAVTIGTGAGVASQVTATTSGNSHALAGASISDRSAAAAPAPVPAPQSAPTSRGPMIGASNCGGGSGGPTDAITTEIFARVNADRAANGTNALAWNPQLYCSALNWSTVQGDAGTFDHSDLQTTLHSPPYAGYTGLGENLLKAPSGVDGDQMHDAWMASATHRANVLQPQFTSIGIALHYTADGLVYATQEFGV